MTPLKRLVRYVYLVFTNIKHDTLPTTSLYFTNIQTKNDDTTLTYSSIQTTVTKTALQWLTQHPLIMLLVKQNLFRAPWKIHDVHEHYLSTMHRSTHAHKQQSTWLFFVPHAVNQTIYEISKTAQNKITTRLTTTTTTTLRSLCCTTK